MCSNLGADSRLGELLYRAGFAGTLLEVGMEVSMLGSLVSVRDFNQKFVKFRSFTVKERFGADFKLGKKFDCKSSGRISFSRRELIDLEERKSPNEERDRKML